MKYKVFGGPEVHSYSKMNEALEFCHLMLKQGLHYDLHILGVGHVAGCCVLNSMRVPALCIHYTKEFLDEQAGDSYTPTQYYQMWSNTTNSSRQ